MQFYKQQNIGYASVCNWRKLLLGQPASEASDSSEAGFLDLSSLMGVSSSTGPGWNLVLNLGNGVHCG